MKSLYVTFFTLMITTLSARAIDQSGMIVLGTNIIHSPESISPAIIITSSDVIIDLNEHIITQDNMLSGINAIEIAASLSNVTIQNGTIRNFTQDGIHVNDGCDNILIKNIVFENCNRSGIFVEGLVTGSGIINSKITNCSILSCMGTDNAVYGLRVIRAHNCEITNCVFNNNDANITGSGFGASLEHCENCFITNCKALENGGNRLAAGFQLIGSTACSISNCTARGTVTRDATITTSSIGFLFNGCSSLSFAICNASNNVSQNGNAIGFAGFDGRGNAFANCVAHSNVGNTVAAGLLITGTETNAAIINSQFVANRASFFGGSSYGILIDGPQGCAISENILAANIGATGIGLRDATTDTSNYIAGNLSYSNTTTGYIVNRTIGSFPAVFASVGDFSNLQDISRYLNIAIT